MEFKQEALVKREMDIAAFLVQNFSVPQIGGQLAVSNKIIKAHIRNMMKKLNAENMEDLIQSIKAKQL